MHRAPRRSAAHRDRDPAPAPPRRRPQAPRSQGADDPAQGNLSAYAGCEDPSRTLPARVAVVPYSERRAAGQGDGRQAQTNGRQTGMARFHLGATNRAIALLARSAADLEKQGRVRLAVSSSTTWTTGLLGIV